LRIDEPSVDRNGVVQSRRERVLGRQPIVDRWPCAGGIGVNDDSTEAALPRLGTEDFDAGQFGKFGGEAAVRGRGEHAVGAPVQVEHDQRAILR